MAMYLYDICERQIAKACKKYLKALPDWYDAGERRTKANNFKRSAVEGLRTKLVDMRKQEKAEQPKETYALVIGRYAKVKRWADGNFKFSSGRYNGGSYRHSRAV